MKPKIDSIRQLLDEEAWQQGGDDDWEDARDIATMARDAARCWKGKGRL